MQSLSENRFSLHQAIFILTLTCVGIGVSAAAWYIWGLPREWAVFGFLALLMPFVLFTVKDMRRFVMWWMIFLIPLGADYKFFYQRSISGHDGVALGTTEIFLMILVLQWLIRAVRDRHQTRIKAFPAIALPTLALAAMCVLSMVNAKNVALSLFDTIVYIKMLIFFLFLANNIRNQEDLTIVLNALFLGLFIESLIMMLQFYRGSSLGLIGTEEMSSFVQYKSEARIFLRPGGTVGNVNGFARYLGFILPIASVMMLTTRNRRVLLLGFLASLAGLVALILTQSRSVWGAYGIGMVLALAFVVTRQLVTMRTLKRISIAALMVAALAVIYGDFIYSRLTSDDHGSAKARLTTAEVALRIIEDHPIIGVGANNYDSYLRSYWLVEDPFTRIAVVHNNYLLIMAEIGIVGFAAFAWLLIALWVRTQRAMTCRVKYFREVAVGIFASLVCFLLASLADGYKSSLTLMYLFWTLAAIIEALIHMDETYREQAFGMLLDTGKNYDV